MAEMAGPLPGNELIGPGIADLRAGRETANALLVSMAAPRLRALGFDVQGASEASASHRLYELLCDEGSGAHSRYNALVRRVVSFLRAAEHAAAG